MRVSRCFSAERKLEGQKRPLSDVELAALAGIPGVSADRLLLREE